MARKRNPLPPNAPEDRPVLTHASLYPEQIRRVEQVMQLNRLDWSAAIRVMVMAYTNGIEPAQPEQHAG